MEEDRRILTADIGGTNSRFALFETDARGDLQLVDTVWLSTTGADSFAQLLAQLCQSSFSIQPNEVPLTVVAVAGPVEKGCYSAPPYIPWDIDLAATEVRPFFREACLINDFVAQAYACLTLVGKRARTILPAKPASKQVMAIVGAGTGLGKATLIKMSEDHYLALPSEGGHTLFPFISQREFAFQEFYREKSGESHITGNLVVSGRGLRHIHWFLTGEDLVPEEVSARFTSESETLAWAARFYGRVCRDYALETLSRGGLYIAGGVAAQNPQMVTHEAFREAFLDSPTMGHILANIPVFLMDDLNSGLWGAAFFGLQWLRQKAVRNGQ